MGKAGFIMQGARGRLGDTIYYKGEQGTMQRVRVAPRNAKTAKQMAQRIIFATVNQAAAWMKSLVNHSFENVPEGEKSVREFTRLNLSLLRQYAADDFTNNPSTADSKVFVTTKGISTLIPNRYVVSKGTLIYDGIIDFASSGPLSGLVGNFGNFLLYGTLKEINKEDQECKIEFKALDVLSLLGIHSANDQLSFVYVGTDQGNKLFDYDGSNTPGFVINSGRARVVRLVPKADITESSVITIGCSLESGAKEIFDTSSFERLFDLNKTDYEFLSYVSEMLYEGSESFPVSPDEEPGAKEIVRRQKDQRFVFSDTWDKTDTAYLGEDFRSIMGGLIRSEYDANNNKWRRSTCVLQGAGPNTDINYGLVWSIANAAWNKGSEIATEGLFLDQGGAGGDING